MSNVKKIKVGSTSYDCKDATARTQVGRINLTKSGNNLVFTDSNGKQHTITAPEGSGGGAIIFHPHTDSKRWLDAFSTNMSNGELSYILNESMDSNGSFTIGKITVSHVFEVASGTLTLTFSPACVKIFKNNGTVVDGNSIQYASFNQTSGAIFNVPV